MIFDADDVLKRAIKIYSAETGISVSDAISKACETLVGEERLDRARKFIASEEKSTPKRPDKEKRGMGR